MTFIASAKTETGIGMKLDSTMASAEALPTATLLGSIKKKIATAATNAPNVITENSLTTFKIFDFFI